MTFKNYTLHKTITYRLLSFLTSFIVVFIVTGSAWAALTISPIDQLIHLFLYYYHEKGWNIYMARKRAGVMSEIDVAVFGDNSDEDDD